MMLIFGLTPPWIANPPEGFGHFDRAYGDTIGEVRLLEPTKLNR
jgi:hypothetical protein